MKTLLASLIILGGVAFAAAPSTSKLQTKLSQEIMTLDQALVSADSNKSTIAPHGDFWVRVMLSKGLLPYPVIGVDIQPEIEIHMTRK